MQPVRQRKTVMTALVAMLLVILLVPPLYRGVFDSPPFRAADSAGMAYVDAAFDRALIAFALARTTNAIISVIQDSEIDIAPAGIGVTIAIGEALDPVNDMVERFSWVMLVSLVSLGIQKILIDISPWISFKLLLVPALLLILTALWAPSTWAHRARQVGLRLVFLAILVRFCVPAVAVLNEQVYTAFLDSQYMSAVQGIEQGNVALRQMDPLSDDLQQARPDGFWADLRSKAGKIGEMIDLHDRVNRMKARLTGMIENLLKMIVIFIMNTILLPIGFLWLLVRLFRLVTGSGSLLSLEQAVMRRLAGPEPVAAAGPGEPVSGETRDDTEIHEQDENIKSDQ